MQVGEKRGREEGEEARFKQGARAAVKQFLVDFATLPAATDAARVAVLRESLQACAVDNLVLRNMLATAAQ